MDESFPIIYLARHGETAWSGVSLKAASLTGKDSGPQRFQPCLGVNFSCLKLQARALELRSTETHLAQIMESVDNGDSC